MTHLRAAGWLVLLLGCTPAQDPQAFLDHEASFLRPGVNLESEEREVRRVLAQRGLRVTTRKQAPGFVALGAANRRLSAVRVITARGVVVAEDAELDDLFQPSSVALLAGFTSGDYSLLAYTRTPAHQDVGCVTVERVLPDANVVPCVIDVSDFGARACISSLSTGRNGALRAKIAWPTLHAQSTPQVDVEVDFAVQRDEHAVPLLRTAPGAWIDQETTRYNAAQPAKADFGARHAIGVVRAALAKLAGKSGAVQVDLYRNAIGSILPASREASLVGETLRHIQSGWLEGPEPPPRPEAPAEVESSAPSPLDQPPPDEGIIVEPQAETR